MVKGPNTKPVRYMRAPRKRYLKGGFRTNRGGLGRMAVGAPQSVIRKLRYTDAFNLAIGVAGGAAVNVFSLNGVYDPDVTNVLGKSARYFDQYMTLYDKYLVLGAKVKVQCYNSSVSTPNRIGIAVQDSPTIQLTGDDYIENERLQRNVISCVEGGGDNLKKMSLNFSTKKWLSKHNVTTEHDLEGNVSSNPHTQVYLHMYADNPFGIQDGGCQCIITIDYIVKFSEPKDVPES